MNNVINNCTGCRYRDYEAHELPCRDCHASGMWEPEEKEKENTEMATTTKKTKAELLAEIEELKKQVERAKEKETYDESATSVMLLKTSFIDAGFTEEEAFELVKEFIKTAPQMLKR